MGGFECYGALTVFECEICSGAHNACPQDYLWNVDEF